MQVITTEGMPPGERFEVWRDIVARTLRFRMEPWCPWTTRRARKCGSLRLAAYRL
jgi:hypothetical protein